MWLGSDRQNGLKYDNFQKISTLVLLSLSRFKSPLCGGGDLLFLLSPPAAAATCFCYHSGGPGEFVW